MAEETTTKRRGRPPKNKEVAENKTITATSATPVKSVESEMSSFVSNSVYSQLYYGMNVFSFYTHEQLEAMIKDPMTNNATLRRLSEMLYSSNGIYTNTIDYMVAMPTLSKVIVTHGSSQNKKTKNKLMFESILKTIKYNEFTRDMLRKFMIYGTAFYYFETSERPISKQKFLTDYDVDSVYEINSANSSGVNASIISLPLDYTKIVGMKNNEYQLAFNLDYFTVANGEKVETKLRRYPEEIRKAWAEKQKGTTGGNWVLLDVNKTIVGKVRSSREEPWGRPLCLAAINDILYGDYFTDTKRNVLDDINNRVVYETFPEGKDKGTCALTAKQQRAQHEAVKGAILNKNTRGGTSFFSVTAGTKIDKIDPTNTDIFDDKYESNLSDRIAMDLGFAASLLSGSGSGSYSGQENNLDLISSQLFMWLEQIESELNKVISENVIKDNRNWCECKYLPITNVNKKNMVEFTKALYLQGKGSLSLWAAAAGISPDVYFALLDQELAEGIEDKYPVHQTSYTLSNTDDSETQTGRPVSEDTTNDSTIKNRNNGTAEAPIPSKQ